jgi:hypothetical protein
MRLAGSGEGDAARAQASRVALTINDQAGDYILTTIKTLRFSLDTPFIRAGNDWSRTDFRLASLLLDLCLPAQEAARQRQKRLNRSRRPADVEGHSRRKRWPFIPTWRRGFTDE